MFEPIYMKKELSCAQIKTALKELEKLNQKKLEKAARKAPLPDIRSGAARLLTDEAVLLDLARNDPDEGVQLTCVDCMKDPASLKIVASNHRSAKARVRAIRRIRDKAFLHLLALHEDDKEAGEAAVNGFSDDIALCIDVINRADNPDIRARAVYAPDPAAWDKDLLYRLAKEHPVPAVRSAAASRLRNDPAFMEQIAREDPDGGVRKKAAELIADPATLVKIGLEDPDGSVRAKAAEQLTDQTALAKIGLTDPDPRPVRIAVGNLLRCIIHGGPGLEKTPEVLAFAAKIALGRVDLSNPREITNRINYYHDIFMDVPALQIRINFCACVEDQAALAEIALNDPDAHMRLVAIGRLEDQEILAQVVINETGKGRGNNAPNAALRITDQAVLARLIIQGFETSSVYGLTDQDALSEVALHAGSFMTRGAAAERLNDIALLKEIAQNDEHESVRRDALKRIEELERDAERQ